MSIVVFFSSSVGNLFFHKTLIKFFKREELHRVELQLIVGGTLTHQVFPVSVQTVTG